MGSITVMKEWFQTHTSNENLGRVLYDINRPKVPTQNRIPRLWTFFRDRKELQLNPEEYTSPKRREGVVIS